MLVLTPPPKRAVSVLWHNCFRMLKVSDRLETVHSAYWRSLDNVRSLPQTRTPLRIGKKVAARAGARTGFSLPVSRRSPTLYQIGHRGRHRQLQISWGTVSARFDRYRGRTVELTQMNRGRESFPDTMCFNVTWFKSHSYRCTLPGAGSGTGAADSARTGASVTRGSRASLVEWYLYHKNGNFGCSHM